MHDIAMWISNCLEAETQVANSSLLAAPGDEIDSNVDLAQRLQVAYSDLIAEQNTAHPTKTPLFEAKTRVQCPSAVHAPRRVEIDSSPKQRQSNRAGQNALRRKNARFGVHQPFKQP
jgi:hypothetical protein